MSVSEPTPLNEAPPSVLCWRAHLTTVVSIDLAEDKGLIVTASTDCCVRLWTMQGRYIGMYRIIVSVVRELMCWTFQGHSVISSSGSCPIL